jgi:hypothetical protein
VLLTLQRRRRAANIPIGWFATAIAIAALYVPRFGIRIDPGPAVVGLIAFAIGVSQTRFLVVRGERLVTRSPFRLDELDARACACGVERVENTRGGPTFVVFLGDGSRSLRMVRCLSLRGAEYSAQRLERALFLGMPEAGRAGARARAGSTRTRWEARLAKRRAYRRGPMSPLAKLGLGAAFLVAVLWTYFLRGR